MSRTRTLRAVRFAGLSRGNKSLMPISLKKEQPWWVLGILYGVIFGAGMSIQDAFHSHSTGSVVIEGVVSGVLFGIFMGKYTEKARLRMRETVGLPGRSREVARALRRTALPSDPSIRVAAARLGRYRLAELERVRKLPYTFYPFMIVLSVYEALSSSRLWYLGTALFGWILVQTLRTFRRLPRRIEQLESTGDSQQP